MRWNLWLDLKPEAEAEAAFIHRRRCRFGVWGPRQWLYSLYRIVPVPTVRNHSTGPSTWKSTRRRAGLRCGCGVRVRSSFLSWWIFAPSEAAPAMSSRVLVLWLDAHETLCSTSLCVHLPLRHLSPKSGREIEGGEEKTTIIRVWSKYFGDENGFTLQL